MLKLAVAASVGLLLFLPAKSNAGETVTFFAGPWQFENVAIQPKTQIPKKKITGKDFLNLDAEIQQAEANEKDDNHLWQKLILRDRMLKVFLEQHPIIGATRSQVREMTADRSKGSANDAQPPSIEEFLVSEGASSKDTSTFGRRPSLSLEVSFKNDVADAFRIVMKGTALRKLRETNPSSVLDKPIDAKKKPWYWKFELHYIIQDLVSRDAEKARISESKVPRNCVITFNVSRDGIVSDLAVKHSSLNSAFDTLVINTVKQISGKPFLHFPLDAKHNSLPLEIDIELHEKDSCNGASVEEFLKGKCKKLNGVDAIP